MPIYNFYSFWIRFAGIINSIEKRKGWKSSTFAEEKVEFSEKVNNDMNLYSKIIKKLKAIINDGETYE